MTTIEFIQLLQDHPDRLLNFEYKRGSRLRPDYHITEVKNVHIDATDCGGQTDSWKETVIQLWEAPEAEPESRGLTTQKALSILKRVDQRRPLLTESPLKFEYGNSEFHTGQFPVTDYVLENGSLTIQLAADVTQCKARETCGQPVEVKESASGCEPGSGCC
jgi:hypothetical protein